MPKSLVDSDFHNEVRENSEPIIIMFTGSWCQPCKQMKPLFESIEEQTKDVRFAYMDIEECPETASYLNIRSVPSFALFDEGMVREIFAGTMTKANLRFWINSNI